MGYSLNVIPNIKTRFESCELSGYIPFRVFSRPNLKLHGLKSNYPFATTINLVVIPCLRKIRLTLTLPNESLQIQLSHLTEYTLKMKF